LLQDARTFRKPVRGFIEVWPASPNDMPDEMEAWLRDRMARIERDLERITEGLARLDVN
jgi:hypothetical protein